MLPPKRPYGRGRKGYSEPHRKFIRLYECLCFGNPLSPCDLDHKTECAHVRSIMTCGMGMKPPDEWLVPLCRAHHAEQHHMGQEPFEVKYNFSMAAKAMEFASQSPDHKIKMAAVEFAKRHREVKETA